MNFPKNYPFEECQFWNFSGFAQFSVLTYFHYFGFFDITLSRSMGENSVILKICPFGYTSLSKSCIWSFCHFCPMHNFLLWLLWKIQLFLTILDKSLPENHASILFCHFGIHSSVHSIGKFKKFFMIFQNGRDICSDIYVVKTRHFCPVFQVKF